MTRCQKAGCKEFAAAYTFGRVYLAHLCPECLVRLQEWTFRAEPDARLAELRRAWEIGLAGIMGGERGDVASETERVGRAVYQEEREFVRLLLAWLGVPIETPATEPKPRMGGDDCGADSE